MITIKALIRKKIKILLKLLFLLLLFQSCKAYQNPTTLEQAANDNGKGYFKITLLNGDEYIYANIEETDTAYYGISTIKGEEIRTLLLKDAIKTIQKQNKTSSGFFKFVGVTILVGSLIFGLSMFL